MTDRFVVAALIPFYQREKGILRRAVQSVVCQSYAARCRILVVDDGSPVPAQPECADVPLPENITIEILSKENGGVASARNAGLDVVTVDCRYVAFLDSDEEWVSRHLEHAIAALEKGYDFYFSDHTSALYKDASNFERIGTLEVREDLEIGHSLRLYRMSTSVTEHTVGDGGGVIGTANVVCRAERFKDLRFHEEFYIGEDFLFWMNLDAGGAIAVFSTFVDCECGRGVNIYSNTGWGLDLALQRLVNELQVWVSVPRFDDLSKGAAARNAGNVRHVQR